MSAMGKMTYHITVLDRVLKHGFSVSLVLLRIRKFCAVKAPF